MRSRSGLAARVSLSAAAALAAVAWCASARACDGDADLLGYYDGERTSAYLVGTLGVAAVAGGAFLVTRRTARSLGWTWLTLGGLESVAAIAYAVQVDGEIDRYQALLRREPERYRAEEIAHIRGTSSRFVFYRITELALVLGGGAVAAYGFATDRDPWKGVGLGVASIALPVAVLDTINDARARRYLRSLDSSAPAVSAAPVSHGFAVSLGGRF